MRLKDFTPNSQLPTLHSFGVIGVNLRKSAVPNNPFLVVENLPLVNPCCILPLSDVGAVFFNEREVCHGG